jgi:apolipoprotein N-acyltransferase
MALRLVGGLTGYVLVAFLVAYVNALLLSVLTRILRSASAPRAFRGVSARAACAIARETPVVLVQFAASLRPRAPPVG